MKTLLVLVSLILAAPAFAQVTIIQPQGATICQNLGSAMGQCISPNGPTFFQDLGGGVTQFQGPKGNTGLIFQPAPLEPMQPLMPLLPALQSYPIMQPQTMQPEELFPAWGR